MVYNVGNLEPFISYKTSRSGGKGGQHVNKVSTKVELLFDVNACTLFNDDEKQRIIIKLSRYLQSEGKLQIICQQDRSQLKNKEIAKSKLIKLIDQALVIPKGRKATRPSKSSMEKRLGNKRRRSLLKINRRESDSD